VALLTYLLFGAADLDRDLLVRFALGDAPQQPLFATGQYWEAMIDHLRPRYRSSAKATPAVEATDNAMMTAANTVSLMRSSWSATHAHMQCVMNTYPPSNHRASKCALRRYRGREAHVGAVAFSRTGDPANVGAFPHLARNGHNQPG